MGPPRGLVVLVVLALVGCHSTAPSPAPEGSGDDDEAHYVERAAPTEPARPKRYEIVETAVLDSGTDASREVEISLPIASTDPGVQEVDSMLVRITPTCPYEIVQDFQGNRQIHVHVKGAESVSCELTYQIARWPVRTDWSKEESRNLTAIENVLLAAELGGNKPWSPTSGHGFGEGSFSDRASMFPYGLSYDAAQRVDDARHAGVPARSIVGIELRDLKSARSVAWHEVYIPGIGWSPFAGHLIFGGGVGKAAEGELPLRLIAVARNAASSEPTATSAGKPTPLAVTYRWREAPER